jgi:hypothetical protein
MAAAFRFFLAIRSPVTMSDGSSIRLKCPLCDADVTVQPDQAGQVITCDFCLEEFPAPAPSRAPKPAPKLEPASPPEPADAVPSDFDDLAPSGIPSADSAGSDVSDLDDLEFGFADELPSEAASSSPSQGSPPLGSDPPDNDPSGLSDEQWLRVDEDLSSSDDEDHPGKKVVLTSDYEFSGPCPLCATRYVATDDQIGTTKRCPDCHTEFEIREPLPGARQPRRGASNSWDNDDEFKLSEPDDPLGIQPPTDDPLGSLDDEDMCMALPLGNSVRPMPTATEWPR